MLGNMLELVNNVGEYAGVSRPKQCWGICWS
jgi:hypothetical protein